MNIKFAFLLISFVLLSGCASNMPPYNPTEIVEHIPDIGKITKTSIGNTLLIYKIEKTYDVLILEDVIDVRNCLFRVRIPEPFAVAMHYNKQGQMVYGAPHVSYGGMTSQTRESPTTDPKRSHQDFWEKKSGLYMHEPHYMYGGGCGGQQEVNVKVTKSNMAINSEPEFLQELIYSGRTGNNIKFLYREYKSGLARGAFSQEVQYDVSISNTIKFKEAEIEVIEATNMDLTYKVNAHFKSIR